MASNRYFTPSQTIQKSYLRLSVEEDSFGNFRTKLSVLLNDLNPTDREETNKGRVKTFLEQTFWGGKDYEVNGGATDLWIKDKSIGRNVVLFEFKKVGDSGMPTVEKLNRKGLHEIILYYIIEEFENANTSIKHLIVTDGYQYFSFEKSAFWELFGNDKAFVREVLHSEHTTDEKRKYIYDQIIKPKVEKVENKLKFTYFDLRSFEKQLNDDKVFKNPKFRAIYKFFSPTHLQKLSFQQDHNTLNRNFYVELLYIMGLEERGDKHQIQRLKENERQPYSLIEQAYTLLADYELPEAATVDSSIDKRFETALGLVIVWINRTLFMKLLESQLMAFNSDKKKYAFFEKLTDFAMMHYLFCKVMAIPEAERSEEMKEKFGEVPYLNSSLFELTSIEKEYFPISSLRNSEIKILKGTCLKDKKGKVASGDLAVLDYLKLFLDSYDFGADAGETGKTIINASVLGLIFEKINGYRDGSFFTPGYITSYLCRETLRRCVTDKYNEQYGTSYKDFNELADDFDYTDKNKRDDVNDLINHIRVCDPAVGSGHFVVSALNELIAIKRELNVLKTIDGKRFKHRVDIEDDELIVTDADGELRYDPDDVMSQLVQETLFEEKRTLIENCLFGVDLNPNSAEICQLRLWIELLKHAYYQPKGADGKRHLQTLPNIDINIKCGNSLVMKYTLDAPIDKVLRGANVTMDEYRKHVADYKNCPSKENKRAVEQDIAKIKSKLNEGYDKETDEYKKWVKVCSEILDRCNSLFPPEEAETKVLMDLRKKEAKLRQSLEEVSSRHARLKAFEWRYEFPEVLNDKGQFEGFDCIIGNPPYGVSIQDEYRKTVEEKYEHVPDYEIYCYFISLGHKLLKNNGYLAYIIPNMWLFNVTYTNYRADLFKDWNIVELLDCTNFQIFDSATVRNTVVTFKKTACNSGFSGYRNTRGLSDETEGKKSKGKDYFSELTQREHQLISNNELTENFSQSWGLALSLTEQEKKIVTTIESAGSRLNDYFDVSQGYIPYRLTDLEKKYGKVEGKLIKEEQRWHSDRKIDDSYQIEIKGENINKYECCHSGVYVKYGKHVGTYVDMKYFESPRLLIREIINPLMACYVEETYINDPGIINIITKADNEVFSLKALWCILNSKLSTYFLLHYAPKASKGLFPKVLITDMNNFPLPKINDKAYLEQLENYYDQIFANGGRVLSDKEQVNRIESRIEECVLKLYGIESEDDIRLINPDICVNNCESEFNYNYLKGEEAYIKCAECGAECLCHDGEYECSVCGNTGWTGEPMPDN